MVWHLWNDAFRTKFVGMDETEIHQEREFETIGDGGSVERKEVELACASCYFAILATTSTT